MRSTILASRLVAACMRSIQDRLAGLAVGPFLDLPEFREAQDDRQRRIELVAGDLDEGRLDAVGLDELGVGLLEFLQQLALWRRPGRGAGIACRMILTSSSVSQGLVM